MLEGDGKPPLYCALRDQKRGALLLPAPTGGRKKCAGDCPGNGLWHQQLSVQAV